ncbi:hypothetical protein PFISCL1PPCAC_13636, partial [Pristionchus fissidentatus]
ESLPYCVNIINNHSPPIVDFPLPDSIHSMEEGKMYKEVVAIRLASSSPAATFRLQNQSDSEWDWLSLSPSGVLSSLRPFDYNKRSSILVRVAVCSLDSLECLPLSFTIQVIDVNDHCPVFDTNPLEASINENETVFPHAIVSIPSARDNDFSPSNRLNCYSIDSPHFFFHPPSSLNIHTNTSFDREITPVIMFKVTAFDCEAKCKSVTGEKNSTLTVTLKINNVNDNLPRFSSRVKHLTIVGGSSVPAGTQMATLSAFDADNEALFYSIKGSIRTDKTAIKQSDAPFFINSSTAHLISRSPLSSPSYSFTIQVNDTANHHDQ